MTVMPPGSTVGIVGGGQLGRMLAVAAAQLGYRAHVIDPDPACCAADVSASLTVARYDDRAALAGFAQQIDVATYEFENVGADPLEEIAARVPIYPPLAALRIAQERVAEKSFAAQHGGRTAPWHVVDTLDDLHGAIAKLGTPAILKTRRFGYDGKGQVRLDDAVDAAQAWTEIGRQPAILEGHVAFAAEFSILIARGQDGTHVVWDAPENIHRHGILDTSTVPAGAAVARQAEEANRLGACIADALGYVGVFAIEFFAGAEGPIFNEMAPRVHNSGHWTIEGAVTSQFENHIRAICGLPLGPGTPTAAGAQMTNLIGDDIDEWPALIGEPGAHLHLYGKGEARPGRKMGHVTRLR